MHFNHNAHQVLVRDFEFEPGDRFEYTYNFNEFWLCDIRVESIETTTKRTPWCLSGSGRQGQCRYYSSAEVTALHIGVSIIAAESAVNEIIAKHMVKKQQMQWSPIGAHYLLQTRTAVLNGELRTHFETRYPALKMAANDSESTIPEKVTA